MVGGDLVPGCNGLRSCGRGLELGNANGIASGNAHHGETVGVGVDVGIGVGTGVGVGQLVGVGIGVGNGDCNTGGRGRGADTITSTGFGAGTPSGNLSAGAPGTRTRGRRRGPVGSPGIGPGIVSSDAVGVGKNKPAAPPRIRIHHGMTAR